VERLSTSIHVPEAICMVMGYHVHIENSVLLVAFATFYVVLHTVTWISDFRWGLNCLFDISDILQYFTTHGLSVVLINFLCSLLVMQLF
jgi:hypothetical protein